jgi:hypothetical protein
MANAILSTHLYFNIFDYNYFDLVTNFARFCISQCAELKAEN